MSDHLKLRVLLTSTTRWPSPSRLAVELSMAGFDVAALCRRRQHPLAKTRAVGRMFEYCALRPIESLARAIAAADPALIVPCDDRAVSHLHELHRRACSGPDPRRQSALIERSLGAANGFNVVMSRYELLATAKAEGLLVPQTMRIAIDDPEALSRGWQRFPCVVKADGTFAGQGVRVARNVEQAERALADVTKLASAKQLLWQLIVNDDPFPLRPALTRPTGEVIAQAYVDGQDANCGVFCWEGEVLAGVAVEVVSTVGAVGPATVVRVVEGTEMMSAAVKIARRLQLSGFVGLDFVIERGSRDHYLIEMNPRCTPVCHLRLGGKRDMIGALQRQLYGCGAPERAAVTANELIAYFPSARTHAPEFLDRSYEDVPCNEPELVEELLSPAPAASSVHRGASRVLQEWVRLKAKHRVPTSPMAQ